MLYGGQGETGYSGNPSTPNGYTHNGGYNGGGIGYGYGGGGGGATHIATRTGILSGLEEHKSDVLIVAGGGAGNHDWRNNGSIEGYGGGIIGGDGYKVTSSGNGYGYGGTQSSGGGAYNGGGTTNISGGIGLFGQVGNCGWVSSADCSGGGGGYYGGGTIGASGWGNGAGGSGYINISKLTSAQTIAGNQSFPNVSGTGNETGHSGNGAAKITPVN